MWRTPTVCYLKLLMLMCVCMYLSRSTVYDSFWENPNMEGNTGFYFVRSSAKSIRLWTETLEACAKNPSLDGNVPALLYWWWLLLL